MWSSLILRLKQKLANTFPGRLLEGIRDDLALWTAMRSMPEQGSRLFQDRCGNILLSSLCAPMHVFIDVGAHIGSVISSVLRNCPDVSVVAIEADRGKAEWLRHKFPGIVVHACAIGDKEGEVEFQIDTARPGYSSIAPELNPAENMQRMRVPIYRLDDLYTSEKRIDVIKIDVEGAELAVLRGGTNLVRRDRPVVYFESGPDGGNVLGFNCVQLFDWFAERGYEILVPNRVAHNGTPLHRDGFLESHSYPQRTLNYFAVPAERRIEIRDRARAILGVSAKARGNEI